MSGSKSGWSYLRGSESDGVSSVSKLEMRGGSGGVLSWEAKKLMLLRKYHFNCWFIINFAPNSFCSNVFPKRGWTWLCPPFFPRVIHPCYDKCVCCISSAMYMCLLRILLLFNVYMILGEKKYCSWHWTYQSYKKIPTIIN